MRIIRRTLSLLLITVFAFGIYAQAHAEVIASTPYVSTGCTDISALLSYGKYDYSTGSQVSALQNFLHAHNYLSVSATGYFGPMTRTAVMVFQKENGLKADGIVGVQTRAHIFAKDCAGSTLPTAAPSIASISPAIGTIGSTVTVNGSGFTSSSIVHFSIGAVPAVVGNNGTTLTFTVPEYIGPYCKPTMACLMYAQILSNGTFDVSVENANGSTSNTVQFVITGKPNPFPQAQ
ncbi:MAG: beta-propeller repeat protein [Candidatus Nomurabacteria bacterium]|nr:beta-propeller repeat protein [Candidatus Nomurabacteria bacterium]